MRDLYQRAVIRGRIASVLKYMFLIPFSIFSLYPFFWIFLSSVKPTPEIYGAPFMFPRTWKLENFATAWVNLDLGVTFFNSLAYAAITVVMVLLFASMASYVLARVRPSTVLYTYFILGIMIPIHAIIIPVIVFVRMLGLLTTRPGLLLVYIAGGMSISVFILTAFMKSIPHELEDAAMIDGCSRSRMFFTIIMPISRTALATVGTFTFLFTWNEFLVASLMAASPRLMTLNLAIANLRGLFSTDFGLICAGLVVLTIPVIVIYLAFQEQVVRGLTAGAVKG